MLESRFIVTCKWKIEYIASSKKMEKIPWKSSPVPCSHLSSRCACVHEREREIEFVIRGGRVGMHSHVSLNIHVSQLVMQQSHDPRCPLATHTATPRSRATLAPREKEKNSSRGEGLVSRLDST